MEMTLPLMMRSDLCTIPGMSRFFCMPAMGSEFVNPPFSMVFLLLGRSCAVAADFRARFERLGFVCLAYSPQLQNKRIIRNDKKNGFGELLTVFIKIPPLLPRFLCLSRYP